MKRVTKIEDLKVGQYYSWHRTMSSVFVINDLSNHSVSYTYVYDNSEPNLVGHSYHYRYFVLFRDDVFLYKLSSDDLLKLIGEKI